MTDAHPDDESLSAALDGEDAGAAEHVTACAACRARSDALAAASRAVARVGHAPAGLADRAVAAALAAFTDERAGAGQPSGTADGATVVPLRPAVPVPGSVITSSGAGRGGGGRRVPAWAMGVAAALLAVLVAVPVLIRQSGDGGPAQVAQRDRGLDASTAETAAPPVEGGDLGDQSDQLALGALLAGAVGGATETKAAGAPAGDPSTTAFSAGQAVDPARTAAPSATGATDAGPPASPASDSASAPDAAAIGACEKAVATDYSKGLGALLYRATLRWQGTPAVLLAYRLADISGNGPDHRAFVMALDGCRLLVVQGF